MHDKLPEDGWFEGGLLPEASNKTHQPDNDYVADDQPVSGRDVIALVWSPLTSDP